jgi:hypothetical protein
MVGNNQTGSKKRTIKKSVKSAGARRTAKDENAHDSALTPNVVSFPVVGIGANYNEITAPFLGFGHY